MSFRKFCASTIFLLYSNFKADDYVVDIISRNQRTENISIYPFDKGSGLVRIKKQDAN